MISTSLARNTLFYLLFASAVAIAVTFLPPVSRLGLPLTIIFAIFAAILGLLLIISAVRTDDIRKNRVLFILNGASMLGIPVFAIMHNLVYGLFISVFGRDFWSDSDETVFFILALVVCPIVYIFSAIIILVKKIAHCQPDSSI